MQLNYPSPILDFTLKYEGGWADNPKDPGGPTMYGVTQATYDWYRTSIGLPKQTVRSISVAERAAIYHDAYWAKIGGDALPDGVDLAAFDYGVNSGVSRAKACLALIGPISDPVAAVQDICASRLSFLKALKTWATFGKGWAARESACEALGVKMALKSRYGAKATDSVAAGISKQLQQHAATAKAKASASAKGAGGAAAAGGAAGIAQIPDTSSATHLPAAALLILGAALLAIVVFLAWRAAKHNARALAYSAEAKAP